MKKKEIRTNEELLFEIKQLKEKNCELEQSKLQSSTWLENSPVCTKILDIDFNLQYMSGSGIKDLKIDDITAFYGKPYPLAFYPDSFKISMTNSLIKAKETGETVAQEASIQNIEGNTLWYHSTIVPISNDEGELDHIMVISLDITSRKEAELRTTKQELKKTEEKYKILFDSMTEMFQLIELIYDENGKAVDYYYRQVNPAFEKLVGKTEEELVGHRAKEIFGTVEDYWLKTYENVDKTGLPISCENNSEELDKYYHIEAWKLKENIIGITLSDNTEKKETQDQLKENEVRFRTLYDNAPLPYHSLNADGSFKDVNITWLRTLGYEREEVIGKFFKDFLHPKGQATFKTNFPKFKERGYVKNVPFKIIHKDGHYMDIALEGCIGHNADGSFKQTYCVFKNITELKHTEEKRRVAEKNLQNTFDLSPSIIAKVNVNTGFCVEANQAIARILGYSVEEFKSKPFIEFVYPDDKQRTLDEILELQKGNRITFFENRYVCKDASYKWLAWHSTKADEDGISLAIGSDITERKIVEQEIIKTKQFYETVIEGVQDGIWVADKNDTIYYANSAMEKIANVPREQIQGTNVLKDFTEGTSSELIKYYKRAKKEKQPVWYVINVKTADNKDKWQNGWLIPQYHKKAFSGIICTVRDITEQSKAEGKVLKLSTAVQHSSSIIVIADTEGKLEYVNPKFEELTGYSHKDVIGRKSAILKSGEQNIVFYQRMWETINSGKVWKGQFHNKKKNGELFWESASISPIFNKSGEVVNYIKIGEDISQQKITEKKLKIALEKALESDRLKSAFLTNMSHEIRTPMNGILGFIDLLNAPDLSKSKVDRYSNIINKSGARLLNTINDIIDISKIESGQMLISEREISINNLLEELYSFHSSEVNQKGLSLIMKPILGKDIKIITDDDKLYGILTNLIKNAIKYTEKGTITFGCKVNDKLIQFFVADTGLGILKHRLQAVFNRFEQADIEDERVFEGSGLGLAISKAYVEMLGGEIFVESDYGKGSKFEFTIKPFDTIKKETEQLMENIDKSQTKIENLNLLIVEDDMVSAELLKTILQDIFKKITHVESGIDAIETCRNMPDIDLILMDVKMPIMGGYDATREIRKFNKGVVIIAQTAYALVGDNEKAIEAGCNDYISKPINKKLLLEMINKHLG